MITLTTPPAVKAVLGGAGSVTYDQFELTQIVHDTKAMTINGLGELRASASPDMAALPGRFTIKGGFVELSFEQILYNQRVKLDAGGVTAIRTFIQTAQTQLEQGLRAIGLVDGTFTSTIVP